MTEAINYIPNRVRNAAVGGHVCGAVDIIDDVLGLEQSSINEDVAPMPYNDGNPNGMGRIILKKTDNFKSVVEAQSGNTIFIIKYDFTLTGDVTVPANCVLQFDGGSISGQNIDLNNCDIVAPLKPIFVGTKLSTKYNKNVFVEWFNILPGITVDNQIIQNLIKYAISITFGYGNFIFNQTINIVNNHSDPTVDDNCKIIKGVLSDYKAGPEGKVVLTFTECDAFNITGSGTIIKDLQIIGNNTIGTWDNTSQMYINSKCAIKTTSGITIENLRISDFGYGIYKEPSSSVVSLRVYDTTISYCGNAGIDLTSSGNGSINHVIIKGCYIVKCGHNADNLIEESTEMYSGHGLHIGDGNGYYISGNVFEYCTGCGIYFSMTTNKRIYGSVVGNTFERNKYTQIYIGIPRNYDIIFVKGNAYNDAGIENVSNALKQREVCALSNSQGIIDNKNLILESYNIIDQLSIPKNEQKEYVYRYIVSDMYFNDNGVIVFRLPFDGTHQNPTAFKRWKVTEAGWYRLSFTAKVDTGSAQLVALALCKNNIPQGNNAITFNTTEYTTLYTAYIWADEGDYINISTNSYYQNITATYIFIKDYDLEKAKNVGIQSERPTFTSTTGLGHQFFNKDTNILQYWNGTEWVDATGTPIS